MTAAKMYSVTARELSSHNVAVRHTAYLRHRNIGISADQDRNTDLLSSYSNHWNIGISADQDRNTDLLSSYWQHGHFGQSGPTNMHQKIRGVGYIPQLCLGFKIKHHQLSMNCIRCTFL
jgi:hypothetical protein